MQKLRTLGVTLLAGGFLAVGAVPAHVQERAVGPATVQQGVPTPGRMAKAAELLDLTHARASLEHWGHMIRMADLASACNCGEEKDLGKHTLVWQNAVDRLFDGKDIYDKVQAALATKFTDAELAKAITFNKSALGRKVNAAMKPQPVAKLDQANEERALKVAAQLLQATPARRAVIVEVVTASGGTQTMVSSLLNIAAGASIGMASAQPAGQPRPDADLILQMIEGSRGMLEQMMGGIMPAAYQNLLKSLSLPELKAYRDELKSPLAIALRDEAMAVMDREVRLQTIGIGRSVAKELASMQL